MRAMLDMPPEQSVYMCSAGRYGSLASVNSSAFAILNCVFIIIARCSPPNVWGGQPHTPGEKESAAPCCDPMATVARAGQFMVKQSAGN